MSCLMAALHPAALLAQKPCELLVTTTDMQGPFCSFALIISLWPGHYVSIKIMSIEKSFLVFTFKYAFMRSAVFHVEWPVLMQTQSLGILGRSSSARGK